MKISKQDLERLNLVWEMGGFTGTVTEENFSECMRYMLEYCPTALRLYVPHIYANLVITIKETTND